MREKARKKDSKKLEKIKTANRGIEIPLGLNPIQTLGIPMPAF
jgi:hypothetical protein